MTLGTLAPEPALGRLALTLLVGGAKTDQAAPVPAGP